VTSWLASPFRIGLLGSLTVSIPGMDEPRMRLCEYQPAIGWRNVIQP
jgi:hypothetical protein